MAWKYWNPNPAGRHVGDCTIRAITRATGETWESAYSGIAVQGFLMTDMPSNNAVWGSYLRRKGFVRRPIPDDKPDDYTVEDFCRDHPKGMYIVAVSGHVLTVVDGDWFDSWDSSKEFPIYYFEKKESEDK